MPSGRVVRALPDMDLFVLDIGPAASKSRDEMLATRIVRGRVTCDDTPGRFQSYRRVDIHMNFTTNGDNVS